MTGVATLAHGSSRSDVLRLFYDHLKAAGTPVLSRAALTAIKAAALAGYARGREEGPLAATPVDTSVSVVRQAPPLPAADAPAPADGEVVAVVVPVWLPSHGRRASFGRLTATVAALAPGVQTRPPDLVVVADDGSSPPLPPLARASGPPLTQLALAPNAGPAAARNAAMTAAAGATLILFTDADCVPGPDWVAAHVAAQAAARGVVSGVTSAAAAGAVAAFHNLSGTLNGRVLPDGRLLYGCTCNLSLAVAPPRKGGARGYAPPADVLTFDAAFRAAAFEDVDLCRRAVKAGLPLTSAPAARVAHAYSSSLFAVYTQFRRYGRAEGQLVAKHPEYLKELWSSVELPA